MSTSALRLCTYLAARCCKATLLATSPDQCNFASFLLLQRRLEEDPAKLAALDERCHRKTARTQGVESCSAFWVAGRSGSRWPRLWSLTYPVVRLRPSFKSLRLGGCRRFQGLRRSCDQQRFFQSLSLPANLSFGEMPEANHAQHVSPRLTLTGDLSCRCLEREAAGATAGDAGGRDRT